MQVSTETAVKVGF